MKRRSYQPLGEAEIEMLQHVWELKRATVAEVHARVLQTREVAYTTVMTVLKKLSDKGYLDHEKEGHAYVYTPAQTPAKVRGTILEEIVDTVFKGSPVALVQTLVQHETLSEEEHAQIQTLLASMRAESEKNSGGTA